AIALARDGFALTDYDASALNDAAQMFARDPAANAIFAKPDGAPFVAGDTLTQPDLAATLTAISEGGRDGFYTGPVAEKIVAASEAKGGLFPLDDLADYQVRELDPVACSYRGYEIVSSPPPSSGGVIICEILNVLEGYPLAFLGPDSAETVH